MNWFSYLDKNFSQINASKLKYGLPFLSEQGLPASLALICFSSSFSSDPLMPSTAPPCVLRWLVIRLQSISATLQVEFCRKLPVTTARLQSVSNLPPRRAIHLNEQWDFQKLFLCCLEEACLRSMLWNDPSLSRDLQKDTSCFSTSYLWRFRCDWRVFRCLTKPYLLRLHLSHSMSQLQLRSQHRVPR